jgi:hypothetical protein
VGVNLGPEALRIGTRILTNVTKKQLIESGSLRTIGARSDPVNQRFILFIEGRCGQLQQDVRLNPRGQFPHGDEHLRVASLVHMLRKDAANASCCWAAGSLAISKAWPVVILSLRNASATGGVNSVSFTLPYT